MLKAKPYSKSEMPEFLPLSEMAFDSSTHELYVGMGENEPIMKVTDSTLDGSPIDYFGNAYKSLKERMDSDVEHLINGFSLVEYTGSHITATNTFAKQVKNAVLKGRTLVNCIQEPSSKDVVLPYSFTDGKYVTINDTKESGALGVELKGQTLVNLYPNIKANPTKFNLSAVTASEDNWIHLHNLEGHHQTTLYKDISLFKPSTQYTVIVEVKNNTLSLGLSIFMDNHNGIIQSNANIEVGFNGTKKFLVTTKNDFSGMVKVAQTHKWYTGTGEIDYRISIIEGNHVDKDIPYFEGMKSVKAPTVRTVGKNLFDIKKATPRNDLTVGENFLEHYRQNGSAHSRFDVPVSGFKVGKYYKYSAKVEFLEVAEGFELNNPLNGYLTGMNDYPTYNNNTGFSEGYITAKSQTITFGFHNSNKKGAIRTRWSNIQIEEVESLKSSKTAYEPYTSSSLILPEEVVLRSLPNGVCDTFNTRTGDYVRRIGEIVLNGSDIITSSINFDLLEVLANTSRCYIGFHGMASKVNMKPHSNSTTPTTQLICDSLPVKEVVPSLTSTDSEGVGQTNSGFSIRLIGKNREECRNRLSQNPVTIQYELATPIITKINLPSTLKSWNTTTHIYSEIPQNSLYPILSQSNPTYPVMLKPNTKYSIIADSSSNGHTNSAIKFDLGGASASTTVGSRVTTITTPSTLNNNLLTMSGCGNKLKNVMVIEGEIVDNVPYFEGMKSVKSPVLISMGESIIDKKMLKKNQFVNTKNGVVYNTNGFARTSDITIEKGKEYFIKFNTKDFDKAFVNIIEYGDGFLRTLTFHSAGVYRATSDCKYIRVSTSRLMTESLTDEVLEKFQLIITDKSNILSTPEDVEYRGIGNVQDTLDLNTGEKVERIGEMILNGNEKWATYSGGGEKEKTVAFRIPSSSHIHSWGDGLGACDKLPFVNGDTIFSKDIEGITSDANGFIIRISKKKCTDLQSLKVYLLSNPIKIQYRLKTPIIKTVDLKGQKLYSYDGITHYICDSKDGSLLPTAQMLVPTKISAFRGELASNLANANVQSKENAHELEVVKESISQGDLELLANDFDLDFRLFEVELNLSVELYSQAKSDSKIYSTAKSLIVGNYYDKDSMTNRLALLLKHGRITVEQHNELLSLMKGDNEHESD